MALFTAMPAWADDVVINEQNFPDENFRNWVLNQEYGKDGVLTEEEIAGVTRIKIYNDDYEIHNLQGIEYFTELTDLVCEVNQLTSLDVSKNTALRYLFCNDNQLTSLDVSECKALTYLDCNNNQLTSLNVTGCESLEDLYCEINQLTSLNVSGCSSLVGISCYLNQLKGREMDALVESLPNISNGILCVVHDKEWAMFYYDREEQNVMTTTQVAAAKAKGWIACERVGGGTYVYNGMEPIPDEDPNPEGIAIDETNFPDANFRSYLLDQDYGKDSILTEVEIAEVTELYVSNLKIRSLKGIEYFIALTRLTCADNQLTSIDVSACQALTELDCGTNQLAELDVSKNTNLTSLWCLNNQLTELDVKANTALLFLNCANNQLTTLDLSNNTKLYYLHCYQNQIRDAGMDALIENLPKVKNGEMFVIYDKNVVYDKDEQNVMTTTQVEVANNKGWTVWQHKYNPTLDPYGDRNWFVYTGSDPADGIENLAADGKPANIYNIAGQRMKSMQRGINIIDGKKVMVK